MLNFTITEQPCMICIGDNGTKLSCGIGSNALVSRKKCRKTRNCKIAFVL